MVGRPPKHTQKMYKYKEKYTRQTHSCGLIGGLVHLKSTIESDIVVCPCILVLGQHKLLTFFLLIFSLKSAFSFCPANVTT